MGEIRANIEICKKKEFSFEKFYSLIHDFKTKTNLNLDELRGNGSEINYIFTNDSETERVNIVFDSKYINLSLDLSLCGSIESFNKYYKEITSLIEKNFNKPKESK